MADENNFSLSDYDRIIDDIMDEYFEQHDINFDLKELVKSQMLGESGDSILPLETKARTAKLNQPPNESIFK